VEALEAIGSPEARRLLDKLAAGRDAPDGGGEGVGRPPGLAVFDPAVTLTSGAAERADREQE
jgi:hypothetical protein